MEFRILGSLEVVDRGRVLSLGAKQRALLAFLLLHPNEVVSSDRLIDALWGGRPPETAQAALQVHVSQLRKALGTARIETRTPGYLLRLEPDELDAARFEALLAEGRGREALALWRGPAVADFQNEPWAQGEIARLEEARLTAVEERIEAELAKGRHAQLVSELEALVREQPLRERLRGQLMLALYRCGRQAAALALYKETRRLLVEELGIEPGPQLQDLHKKVLNQDPALAPLPAPPTEEPPAPPPEPRQERKVVTVLFCDLVESTALADHLDPEVQQRVLSRYFDTVSHVLARHGGTVEKFIGDAVMAVFGVPRLHEDDALRAVRAAAELQEALEVLSAELTRDLGIALRARIGVNSGEVIVGGRPVVTGEAVNAASHLEQAAPPGRVLVGETTFGLVREAVRAEPVELELKGKPSSVRAWRLLELIPGAAPFARRLDTPLVGRALELEQLRQGLARAVRDRRAVLLTVLGAAGIGKTRLVGEFLASVAPDARALVGRCLPYGEGITFWPLVEIVRELAGDEPREWLLELLSAEEERAAVVESILGAVGGDATASTEESFWAVRRLFESLARERPLVVCFEDVHWAEATLLDLIEHLTEWTSDAPLLLVCLARPEFVDESAGRSLNARSIVLDPLTEQESERLIDLLGEAPLDPGTLARLRERSGGNPLFVEQMLAHLNETPGAGDVSLPPSIHALLATRLERLDPGERAVIERAAVVGQEFWLRAVTDLGADGSEQTVRRRVQGLVRKELVRPHRSFLTGEEAFVFNHVLIRDAAYRSISKELRGELHERFAEWVERKPGEYEEIFAYHLEQAYLYRAELGPLGARERALGEKAAGLLLSVGRRALRRGDLPAAENLLSRAATVLEPDAALLSAVRRNLAIAHYSTGRLKDAETILVSLVESAGRSRDRAAEWAARTELALSRMATAGGVEQSDHALEIGLRAVEILEEEGDQASLARAWLLVSEAHNRAGRQTARREAAEHALAIARRAGDDETERRALGNIGGALFIGPTPAGEGIERMEPELADVRASGRLAIEATALGNLGILEALRANFEQARSYVDRRMSIFEELGLATLLGTSAIIVGQGEVLANRTEAAADAFRRGYDLLAGMGETGVSCTLAAMLGNALAALGDVDEALRFAQISEETGEEGDVVNQILLRTARARALERAGRLGEAEAIAREAAAIAMETDFLYFQPFALLDLAHVLRSAGKEAEAVPVVEEAIALCERKGNVPLAERARSLLAELAALKA